MRIYIDEAGSFVRPDDGRPSYCLVLALVVPDQVGDALLRALLRLRGRFSVGGGEVKGSRLSEFQAAQVVALAWQYDVVAVFCALDMAAHPPAVVRVAKAEQADAVAASVTPLHQPGMIAEMRGLADAIRRMPEQLFLQMRLVVEVMFRALEAGTLYYVQRQPRELGNIAWVVDRKDRAMTEMERTWSALILPWCESRHAREPFVILKGEDYSHFDRRYGVDLGNEDVRFHIEWLRDTYGAHGGFAEGGHDARKLYSEQLDFSDSAGSPGLQLADMLAAILRRALNGRLQPAGWQGFGRLLVRSNRGPFLRLAAGPTEAASIRGHALSVWERLESRSKEMWLREG